MSLVSAEEIAKELQAPQKDYAAAKKHSESLDLALGFRCAQIEDKLFEENQSGLFSTPRQFWYGLDIQSMQTPYSEIFEMLSRLSPQAGETWLDLGAAYGRIGISIGFLRGDLNFLGYEFVAARVIEGNRVYKAWNLKNVQLKQVDLAAAEFNLDAADVYFIYDFGSKDDIYIVLEKMRIIAQKRPIQVIARGRGIRNWIFMDFPWLYDVHPPEHFANWTLFKS
jgi:hypothetical protein